MNTRVKYEGLFIENDNRLKKVKKERQRRETIIENMTNV